MSHAVTLVTDDRNRVQAQMPMHLALTLDHPGPAVPPPTTDRRTGRHPPPPRDRHLTPGRPPGTAIAIAEGTDRSMVPRDPTPPPRQPLTRIAVRAGAREAPEWRTSARTGMCRSITTRPPRQKIRRSSRWHRVGVWPTGLAIKPWALDGPILGSRLTSPGARRR